MDGKQAKRLVENSEKLRAIREKAHCLSIEELIAESFSVDRGNGSLESIEARLAAFEERLLAAIEQPNDREWYSVKDAAIIIKRSQQTLRQACNTGRVPAKFLKKQENNTWRISKAGIDWILNNGFSRKVT